MGLSVKEMTGVPGKVILTVTVVMQLINLLLSSASIVSRVILLEAVLEIPLLSEICELGTQAIFFLNISVYFLLFCLSRNMAQILLLTLLSFIQPKLKACCMS